MFLLALLSCGPSLPAPEPFLELQPAFFQGLAVDNHALGALEARFDTAADRAVARIDAGSVDDDTGLVLLYAGFLPHDGVHLVEDGYLQTAEIHARVTAMERSKALLTRAAALRPTDTRIPVMLRSVDYNLAVLRGTDASPIIDAMVTAADQDWFAFFAALDLLRDPAKHPMSAAYMDKLLHIACRPDRFDCDRPPPGPGGPTGDPAASATPPGPPLAPEPPGEGTPSTTVANAPPTGAPPPGPPPDDTLTRSVVGPVLVSDLLVRRAEFLLAANDPAALPEVMGRLGAAHGLLAYARANVERPALARFPFADTLPRRAERSAALEGIAGTRMGGGEAPVTADDWYGSKGYRGPYQCAACHTYGEQKVGVPK